MDGYKHFVKIKRLAPFELMYNEKGNSKCSDWGGCVDSGRGGYSDEEIVKYSLDLTAELLRFTRVNALKDGKANCVGYAQLCSNICNYAFAGSHSKARTKPVVGYIEICGIDMCKVAYFLAPAKDKNFVKDHDFVEYHHQDGTTSFFDPSIYDVSFGLHGK